MFGVRLPQQSECLTSIDFDLVPNKPPPGKPQFDEIEEIVESESEDDEDMEPAPIPFSASAPGPASQEPQSMAMEVEETPFPISAIQTDITAPAPPADEGSDAGDHEDLFAGGDDDEGSDAMEEVQTGESATNGVKRKLVEEDDYD